MLPPARCKTAIRRLSATKYVSLASIGPGTGYNFRDTWTKADSTEAAAVTRARETQGTLPMQEARRIFLSPLPRLSDHKLLEGMVRELFPNFIT